ncbi:DUF3486 family protein [Ponticoccus gilvus]|nr:DUF3486 family protein [Enemella evansiae]
MPPPKKLDRIPEDDRAWLIEELRANGYGSILAITDELNIRLERAGHPDSVSKSAVGDFSKALKDQREAFAVADALMQSMDVKDEGKVQAGLYQMISATAMHAIMHVRDEGGQLSADESAKYARMMKDLMASSGMREKLLEGERVRIAREAREAAQAEMDEALEATATEAGLDAEMLSRLRKGVLGLRS